MGVAVASAYPRSLEPLIHDPERHNFDSYDVIARPTKLNASLDSRAQPKSASFLELS